VLLRTDGEGQTERTGGREGLHIRIICLEPTNITLSDGFNGVPTRDVGEEAPDSGAVVGKWGCGFGVEGVEIAAKGCRAFIGVVVGV
jgi:hypothetical protein